jgi:hypothetical protein
MRRILLAVALTASFAPMASSFFGPLQALLSSLWDAPATLDEGCGADPSGRCTTAPQPQFDAGCGADPNGRCQPGS